MQYINPHAVAFVRAILPDLPRPDKCAAVAFAAWARRQGVTLDPDQVDAVTLHYQRHEGVWQAVVTQRMSLTQAVIGNWQGESTNDVFGAILQSPWAGKPPPSPLRITDTLHSRGALKYGEDYQVFNGLYHRTQPARYDADNWLELPAEGFQAFIWHLDFHKPFKQKLDTFWARHFDNYCLAARLNFVAASNKQRMQGSLSAAGQRLTLQVAGLVRAPQWADHGQIAHAHPVLRVAPLNIYGYPATDILCISNLHTGLTLLYIPGNSSPLHEFVDEPCMKLWIAEQCRDVAKRQALQAHFAPRDVDDGLSFSGLATALRGLGHYPDADRLRDSHAGFATSGVWHPQSTINYKPDKYSPPITGDVFAALAKRKKNRCYQDADFIIDSDRDVEKARWREYLSSTINTLAPIACIVPELAPLFAIGGVAQFGLALDQTVEAKTLDERVAGVEGQVYGLLNALPLAHAVAGEASIFRFEDSAIVLATDPQIFIPPRRVNGRIGYPMSPTRPPRLPMMSEDELREFFRLPSCIDPLPGGDTVISDAVVRQPQYDGGYDLLQGHVDSYLTPLSWDVETNTFVPRSGLNDVQLRHLAAPIKGSEMVDVAPPLPVASQAQRQACLRALGVDLQLPVDLRTLEVEGATPIPKKISCVWIGSKLIGPEVLENLGANAAIVEESKYEYRLYLTQADPEQYARNVDLLARHAPGLKVIPLEQDPLYAAFANSKYFAQYQAALDGNGGLATNYASACDVLRYRILHAEGGLYMDVDDNLLRPGQLAELDGVQFGLPAVHLDDAALLATPDGLVLSPPVSSELMGMSHQYNNSFIGSHPGNPTLDAVSDEIHARYQTSQDFYDSRPDRDVDPWAFGMYARRLSYLTGPRVLNDVAQARLPTLKLLSQLRNFAVCPTLNGHLIIDKPEIGKAFRRWLPLDSIALVRGSLSWAST